MLEILEMLKDVPPFDVGAPLPIVMSNDLELVLSYYVSSGRGVITNQNISIVVGEANGDTQALVRFSNYISVLFGMPNDEALHGHPLYGQGLDFYNTFQVHNSSWVHELERMNSVHSQHDPAQYAKQKHFIFTFHDVMFECVAESYSVTLYQGCSRETVLSEMGKAILGLVSNTSSEGAKL